MTHKLMSTDGTCYVVGVSRATFQENLQKEQFFVVKFDNGSTVILVFGETEDEVGARVAFVKAASQENAGKT